METRRYILKKVLFILAAALIPKSILGAAKKKDNMLKTLKPENALVLWYSQAGHTRRIGRLIAYTLDKLGLKVLACDIQDTDKLTLGKYDLIVIGVPVFYMDVPGNVRDWLSGIPRIDGTAVAAFVTYGGPGGSQHNTACRLLEILSEKGGVPVGMELFGNMSTFAPTWSAVSENRILKYKHLPNEGTYKKARTYAASILEAFQNGNRIKFEKEFNSSEISRILAPVWFTKLMIGRHTIDKNKCINCGTCVEKCPVSAIEISSHSVNTSRCIACMGCINNCPAGAVDMTFMGKRVYGFIDFLKRNNVKIEEPVELITG